MLGVAAGRRSLPECRSKAWWWRADGLGLLCSPVRGDVVDSADKDILQTVTLLEYSRGSLIAMYLSIEMKTRLQRDANTEMPMIISEMEHASLPRYQQESQSCIIFSVITNSPTRRSATARERMSRLVGVWSCLK